MPDIAFAPLSNPNGLCPGHLYEERHGTAAPNRFLYNADPRLPACPVCAESARYRIDTPIGNVYELDGVGRVLRGPNGPRDPRDSHFEEWKIYGLVKILPGGRFDRETIPLATAARLTDWLFKNGKPRYTMATYDHGYHGVTGNTAYHGVLRLTRTDG